MINVIGMGYIGLPTALMMASHGLEVIGTDYNKSLIDRLNDGVVSFEEDGLPELFETALKSGIKFTNEYMKTSIYIISVPTPCDEITKRVDVTYIVNALKSVLKVCDDNSVVVIESTISPGTIDTYIRPIVSDTHKKIHLAHAPERIIPGNMIYELENNNRTIGADDISIGERIKSIYASFCKGKIVVTDIRTAEMTKVIENTYRAVNIAFANEITQICNKCDMDVYEIIKICNMHPRVNILTPGPGVGGHCIPIDPWFLVGDYPLLTKVIGESMKLNAGMPEFVLNQIYRIMRKHDITDISKVGLYGLTYKEDTDDVRESPTLQLIDSQKKHLGSGLRVYDPMVNRSIINNQEYNFDEFIKNSELIVVMVGHSQIKKLQDKLKGKIVYDTRNVINMNEDFVLYKLGDRI